MTQSDDETRGNGQPGDFDFLSGEWRIANRMLQPGSQDEWLEFPGEATCWSILEGVGSIEELRIPVRDFSGMGLRLLHRERGVWNDFWVNSKSGELTADGLTGVFVDGVGSFTATEQGDDGSTTVVRGVWDHITVNSCRWRQGISHDGGATWFDSWFMEWTRAGQRAPR